jgi:gluconolactonase
MLRAMRNQPLVALLTGSLLVLITAMGCANGNDRSSSPAASTLPSNNLNPPMVAANASGTVGSIERLDPAIDELLAPDAKIELLVNGLQWAEGPVWSAGGLYFSDVPQNTLYRWTPTDGVHPFLKPSGYTGVIPRGGEPGSNGLTLDHQGRLVICQHGDRRVVRLEHDGKTLTVLADRYKGMRFSSPNDLCFDSHGNLYFTDPPYGLVGHDQDPTKEMDLNGVYLRRPSGELIRLDVDLKFPNGIAFTPDEKGLYILVSDPNNPVVMKYDVQGDGTVMNGRVNFDASALHAKGLPGLPDGMKVDVKGNTWFGGPGGILVVSSEGKHLATLLTGVKTANCGWGDDGSTLYICSEHRLLRIKTKTKGKLP